MEIGKKIKEARLNAGMTQEKVAEEIHVSRQTISNWENEKNYPDIISVILLSDLYQVSLDELLKGDKDMIKHLDESTNIVKSNRKLIGIVFINILLMVGMVIFGSIITSNRYLLFSMLSTIMVTVTILFYQIIRRF